MFLSTKLSDMLATRTCQDYETCRARQKQGIEKAKAAGMYVCKAKDKRAREVVKSLLSAGGNDSNLLIVFYVQIMPDDFVMQLHR
ncbi:hypothetical protein LP586_15785, partial [Escherichia coli]|nr:hypothetical protein [Escherichia coli]